MAILIWDPNLERRVRAEPEVADPERPTEVWEGVTVVPPMANTEHCRIAAKLTAAFVSVVDWDRGDQAMPGANVSDRDAGWEHNYRNPDVLVVLAGGAAVDRGAHWQGGPDLVVEIISRGEDPLAKFAFYAAIGTREVLVVDRDPWAVELYQLRGGRLVLAGRSDEATGAVLTSSVLPLTVRLVPGQARPKVEVAHPPTGRRWEA